MTALLDIRGLSANIGDKKILDGVSLAINFGEIHFLMGPNGSGKTTLASALMGNPTVVSAGGTVVLNGEDITTALPEERAKKGLYLGFQYPVEVPGVPFTAFLRSALAAQGAVLLPEDAFRTDLE